MVITRRLGVAARRSKAATRIESGHEESGSSYDGTAWEQEHYKIFLFLASGGGGG